MKIGILGGGQLGRMLWEASLSLKPDLVPSVIFHETKKCPAGSAGAEVVEGKIEDVSSLTRFFESVDTFAIENEFLPLQTIQQAWQNVVSSKSPNQAHSRDQIPKPSWIALQIAQDKLEQKKFFVKNKFPTSDFVEVTADWFSHGPQKLQDLHTKWQGLVLKKARMGYDGKGNFALPPSLSTVFTNPSEFAQIQEFCESAFQAGSRVYAEKFVPFQKEVALVSVQSFAKDFGYYPLIETVQKNGVCFLAFKALDSLQLEKQAAEIAQTIAKELDLLGTFAVEFFVSENQQLIVNEMAPRVHNSGHFTQTSAKSSQFEMHLKSYYQNRFTASDFECAPAFAMVNLLGPASLQGEVRKPAIENVYWYDKERTSPGRKLGHILASSQSEKDLTKLLEQLKRDEQRWQESLKV